MAHDAHDLRTSEGRLQVGPASDVSWILLEPDKPTALYVFGHGAGANMRHATMTAIATELARRGVAVFRFNFPFLESTKRPVDSRPVATATVAAAVSQARALRPTLPLFIGGHSFGGRMASHAIVERDLGDVRGLVLCSFPLHPADKPGIARAAHLDSIEHPMLFLSGTRDALATPDLLRGVVERLTGKLGDRATLVWLETADHSYKVQKRARTRADGVFEELADAAVAWIARR
jgi:predicted alpha/beta-hydrolase family hydrolase